MNHLGVDLSKKYFDATLELESKEQFYAQFDNCDKGFRELKKWLDKYGVQELHICMEATNVYWEGLADFLHKDGYTVSVVNPMRIKGFAMSQLQRNKTDKLDSQVIVAFCIALSPQAWVPPTTEQRKLRNLTRNRDALIKAQTQQKNRLADCLDDEVRSSIETILSALNSEIESMEKRIQEFVNSIPELMEMKELLLSIKGIGETTAYIIMSEMYDLADYKDAKAAAADAGVSPSHQESGDTVRRKSKMCKVGKAAVRRCLYFPAISAIRHNPIVKAMAERMKRQNKPNMVIIGAAMRKLIHIAYGVLRNKTSFDPQWESNTATI